MKVYFLKFTQLSKYAPAMVADSKACMSKIVLNIFELVTRDCMTIIIFKKMNLFKPMTYAHNVEE